MGTTSPNASSCSDGDKQLMAPSRRAPAPQPFCWAQQWDMMPM